MPALSIARSMASLALPVRARAPPEAAASSPPSAAAALIPPPAAPPPRPAVAASIPTSMANEVSDCFHDLWSKPLSARSLAEASTTPAAKQAPAEATTHVPNTSAAPMVRQCCWVKCQVDLARSEERRVGKECRSRGLPQHGKKNCY